MSSLDLKWALLLAVILALVGFTVAPVSAEEQGDESTVMVSGEDPDLVPAAAAGDTNPPFYRTGSRPGEGAVTQMNTDEVVTGHGGVAALRGSARPVA